MEALLIIFELQEENENLKKQIYQMKYYRSDKGYEKMQRNNERRRNKTKFKKVLKELRARPCL